MTTQKIRGNKQIVAGTITNTELEPSVLSEYKKLGVSEYVVIDSSDYTPTVVEKTTNVFFVDLSGITGDRTFKLPLSLVGTDIEIHVEFSNSEYDPDNHYKLYIQPLIGGLLEESADPWENYLTTKGQVVRFSTVTTGGWKVFFTRNLEWIKIGDAALLLTPNTFSSLNNFNGNIGLAENNYVGYPSVVGASYTPTEGVGYNSILNGLNNIFVNLDSGAGGSVRLFKIGKGRTGISGGTDIFQVDTNGFFSFFLENSFMGYPGSNAQGISPFDSGYNLLINSLNDIVFNIDSGNTQTTKKFIFGHNDLDSTPTEIASLTEAGLFSFMDGGNFAFGASTGTKIGTGTSQKLSFWNSSPIVQPTISASNSIGAVLTDNTGGTGTADTINVINSATIDTSAAKLTDVQDALHQLAIKINKIRTWAVALGLDAGA